MQTVKLDPIAYVLILGVLAVQVYVTFLRPDDVAAVVAANDALYQRAVFEDEDNKGVFHQVFRQNEVNRELLKQLLTRCGQ